MLLVLAAVAGVLLAGVLAWLAAMLVLCIRAELAEHRAGWGAPPVPADLDLTPPAGPPPAM